MNDDLVSRRTFLSAAGAAVLTAAQAIEPTQSLTQQPVPNSSGIEPAKLKAPAGAADCHIHIYDPRFPQDNQGRASPKNATVDDYRLLQKRIGVEDHRRRRFVELCPL